MNMMYIIIRKQIYTVLVCVNNNTISYIQYLWEERLLYIKAFCNLK